MDYNYTIIYRFEGISENNLDEDKVVYQDDSLGITVVLTKDINRHCLTLDTGLASAGLLLRGTFGDEKTQELPNAIDAEVARIQEERVSKKKTGAYAVINIKGQADLNIKENHHKETDQFCICFDAIDKEYLKKQHKEQVHSIISSLSISIAPEYHAEKISSGIFFIDSNEKPLYSFTFQGGHARLILAKPIDIEKEKEISEIIGLSMENQQVKTPFRLLTQSLETTEDKLRAFIFAWTALEILTNKIFSIYEEKFIVNISDDHNSHGVNEFLKRIKDVMKDKYRITDKFALIASFLSNEETLPVEDARKLAAKYLMGHMLSTKNA